MNSCRAKCLAAGLGAGLVVGSVVAPVSTAQSLPTSTGNPPKTNSMVPAASGRLQGLVRATSTQLQIAYRHDAEEHQLRREQLAAAVAAWRAAARSPTNDQLMADWLRAAIRKSMPGSRESLPAAPNFERPVVSQPKVTTPTVRSSAMSSSSPTSTLRQKPVVENESAPRVTAPSSRPAAEKSLVGQQPADREVAAPVGPMSTPSTGDESAAGDDAEQNFWSAHPANSDLPAELSSGDPFRDDP